MPYALEQLFVDQDRGWVAECIAPVLAWVPGTSPAKARQPFHFPVEHTVAGEITKLAIDLTWDVAKLDEEVPGVDELAKRLREGHSVLREHVAQLAAYGLGFVAISVLLPGRRVKSMRRWQPPDILFDVTPNALRGVEVAGRSRGGRGSLLAIRDGTPATKNKAAAPGKKAQLLAMAEIVEVHLSLWSASRRHSIFEQVKP